MFIQDRKWYLEATGSGEEKEIWGDVNRSQVELDQEMVDQVKFCIRTLEFHARLRNQNVEWVVNNLENNLMFFEAELEKSMEADRLLEEMTEGEYLAAKTKAMEEHIADWGEKAA